MARSTTQPESLIHLLGALLIIGGASNAQCSLDWASGFSQRGLSGPVQALQVCDLGNGPELFAAGGMVRDHGQFTNYIVKWNGSFWEPLGSGLNGTALTLAAANLGGAGTKLFVGGVFNYAGGIPANGSTVATWNGASWAWTTYNGSNGGGRALKVWPGNPTLLYGINGNMLSVMNGGPWLPVASVPYANYLTALEVFDDGTGPHVYVAGNFPATGGVTLNHIAKWTGSAWVSLGGGMNDWVSSLTVYDDGTGPALIAGGAFTVAGGVTVNRVAKWNGQSWSSVGGGVTSGMVYTVSTQDWGQGPRLLASGYFSTIGGVQAANVASWNGASWAPLGSGLPPGPGIAAFAVHDGGSGPMLIAGGEFLAAGGEARNYIARWDGVAWHSMPDGNGFEIGDGNDVKGSVVFDDGSGPALYLCGRFLSAGPAVSRNVIRFDGQTWTPVGGGMNGDVDTLAVFDDGGGPALYAGGNFSLAGGVPVNNVAKWNGNQWSALGLGLVGGICYTLEPITSGPYAGTLAAGGGFHTAGGYSAWRVAFWTGSVWLSTWTVTQTNPLLQECFALGTFDDGTGPALYAGGTAMSVSSCWKYDGTVWSQIGTNIGQIYDFQVFDPGTGPHFYAGANTGIYVPTMSFGVLAGSSFTAVPGSLPTTFVRKLHVHQDETGSALYLGGTTSVPGYGPTYLMRWNGSTYSQLGAGLGGLPTYSYGNPGNPPMVETLTSFDDGTGPALFAAGSFTHAGSHESTLIARWAARRPTLFLTQAAPGAGVVVSNGGLVAGHDYHNVFSLETCASAGGGPYLGLCATNVSTLLDQLYLPTGAVPFHFVAGATSISFGPYAVAAGVVFDGVSFDTTGGALGCVSTVRRFVVQ